MIPWKRLIAVLCLALAPATWVSADRTAAAANSAPASSSSTTSSPAPAAPAKTAQPKPKASKRAAKKKTEKFKPTRPYVDGEILVQFKDGPESESAVEANRKVGGTVVKVLAKLRLALIQLPPDADTIKAVETYRRQPGVVTAEPNYVVSALKAPIKKPAPKTPGGKPLKK